MLSALFNLLCIGSFATFGLTCSLINKLCCKRCGRAYPAIECGCKPAQLIDTASVCTNTSNTRRKSSKKYHDDDDICSIPNLEDLLDSNSNISFESQSTSSSHNGSNSKCGSGGSNKLTMSTKFSNISRKPCPNVCRGSCNVGTTASHASTCTTKPEPIKQETQENSVCGGDDGSEKSTSSSDISKKPNENDVDSCYILKPNSCMNSNSSKSAIVNFTRTIHCTCKREISCDDNSISSDMSASDPGFLNISDHSSDIRNFLAVCELNSLHNSDNNSLRFDRNSLSSNGSSCKNNSLHSPSQQDSFTCNQERGSIKSNISGDTKCAQNSEKSDSFSSGIVAVRPIMKKPSIGCERNCCEFCSCGCGNTSQSQTSFKNVNGSINNSHRNSSTCNQNRNSLGSIKSNKNECAQSDSLTSGIVAIRPISKKAGIGCNRNCCEFCSCDCGLQCDRRSQTSFKNINGSTNCENNQSNKHDECARNDSFASGIVAIRPIRKSHQSECKRTCCEYCSCNCGKARSQTSIKRESNKNIQASSSKSLPALNTCSNECQTDCCTKCNCTQTMKKSVRLCSNKCQTECCAKCSCAQTSTSKFETFTTPQKAPNSNSHCEHSCQKNCCIKCNCAQTTKSLHAKMCSLECQTDCCTKCNCGAQTTKTANSTKTCSDECQTDCCLKCSCAQTSASKDLGATHCNSCQTDCCTKCNCAQTLPVDDLITYDATNSKCRKGCLMKCCANCNCAQTTKSLHSKMCSNECQTDCCTKCNCAQQTTKTTNSTKTCSDECQTDCCLKCSCAQTSRSKITSNANANAPSSKCQDCQTECCQKCNCSQTNSKLLEYLHQAGLCSNECQTECCSKCKCAETDTNLSNPSNKSGLCSNECQTECCSSCKCAETDTNLINYLNKTGLCSNVCQTECCTKCTCSQTTKSMKFEIGNKLEISCRECQTECCTKCTCAQTTKSMNSKCSDKCQTDCCTKCNCAEVQVAVASVKKAIYCQEGCQTECCSKCTCSQTQEIIDTHLLGDYNKEGNNDIPKSIYKAPCECVKKVKSCSTMMLKRRRVIRQCCSYCSVTKNDTVLIQGDFQLKETTCEPLNYVFQTQESDNLIRVHKLSVHIRKRGAHTHSKNSIGNNADKCFIKLKVNS